MKVLVIDGQGGRLGKQLCEELKAAFPSIELTAVGTNSAATAAMQKGGADRFATGENAAAVCCRHADLILGPVGIAIADSLLGEVTPSMALAVGQSSATKILIPMNKCENLIAGVGELTVGDMVADAIRLAAKVIKG